MNNNGDKATACVVVIILAVVMLTMNALISGLVLSVLWGWFVVPLFPSAPTLTIPYAIGLSLLASMLIGTSQLARENNDIFTAFANSILTSLLALLIGWIVTLFI